MLALALSTPAARLLATRLPPYVAALLAEDEEGVGGGSFARWFNNPDFQASLTSSIIPDKGSGSATFTRATTAYVCDWEGVCRSVLAGEARFYGARRVANLLTNTENMTGAGWGSLIGGTGTAAVCTAGFVAPDGTATAFRVQANIGTNTGADFSEWISSSSLLGDGRNSIWLKSNTGANQQVLLRHSGAIAAYVVTVTPAWQRLSILHNTTVLTSNTFSIGTRGTIGSDQAIDVLAWRPQMESVAAQSNQSPGEYVSVGVLASPFQGAGVDGVQYFEYQNGNVVAANVVTAGTGAPLGPSVLLGYLAEQQSTNLCLQSEDLATTWAASSATVTVNSTAAPNGTQTADTIVATAASGNLNQSFAKAASALAYTLSTHFKPGTVNIVRLQIGDTNAFANGAAVEFNVNTGVISTAAATIGAGWSAVSATIKQLSNGYYRLTLTATSSAVATLAVSVGHNAAAVATNTLIGWGHGLEQFALVTSYIPTTTAAVTRNADVLTYPTAGNVSDTAGTIYTELAFQGVTPALTCIAVGFQSAGVGRGIYTNATSTQVRAFDGTTAAISAVGPGFQTNVGKAASVWGGGFLTAYLAGGAGAAVAYDGTMAGVGPIGIGNAGDGLSSWNGTIRNVRIWKAANSDAYLVRATS